jgi:Leucine carboxyl methyltransferase
MLEPPTRHGDPDAPIRSTDNDAAIARLSAVRKGYLIDRYIAALVPHAHLQQPRPPLINIGTYLRARGIDDLLDDWFRLAGGRKVQIVSLGAGSDTRFWRLTVRTVPLDEIEKQKEVSGWGLIYCLLEWSICGAAATIHRNRLRREHIAQGHVDTEEQGVERRVGQPRCHFCRSVVRHFFFCTSSPVSRGDLT